MEIYYYLLNYIVYMNIIVNNSLFTKVNHHPPLSTIMTFIYSTDNYIIIYSKKKSLGNGGIETRKIHQAHPMFWGVYIISQSFGSGGKAQCWRDELR